MIPYSLHIVSVDSYVLDETSGDVILWATLNDRSVATVVFSAAEVAGRAHVICEQNCERPLGLALH